MFKTNEYFDGKVKSLGFQTENLPATIGVMAPGDYVFNTNDKERMTVVSGAMEVRFPESETSIIFNEGESFDVEASSSFNVLIIIETAYLCLYGE